MSFRMAFFMCISVGRFRCRFVFLFLRPSGFHLRGKTGFSASLLHGKKSFFRLLVQVARKFCGHWKIAFSRMIFCWAENESRKCRMEAKDVLDVCFFVNVWLPFAGNILFCSGVEWGACCLFVGVLFFFLAFCLWVPGLWFSVTPGASPFVPYSGYVHGK